MKLSTILVSCAYLLFAQLSPLYAQQPPDKRADVQRLAAGYDLTTPAGSGCFTAHVAFHFHQDNPNWGHLKKRPGQNHYNGHAVDAIHWKPTGQAVDIVIANASPSARPGWIVDEPRYGPDDFLVPANDCAPGAEPPPPPDDPPAPPADLEPIREQLRMLEAALSELRTQIADTRTQIGQEAEARINGDAALREDIAILYGRPIAARGCRAALLGIPVSCGLVP